MVLYGTCDVSEILFKKIIESIILNKIIIIKNTEMTRLYYNFSMKDVVLKINFILKKNVKRGLKSKFQRKRICAYNQFMKKKHFVPFLETGKKHLNQINLFKQMSVDQFLNVFRKTDN